MKNAISHEDLLIAIIEEVSVYMSKCDFKVERLFPTSRELTVHLDSPPGQSLLGNP